MPVYLARIVCLMKIITLRGVFTLVLTLVFSSVIAQSGARRAANAIETVGSFSKAFKSDPGRAKSKYKSGDSFNPGGSEIGSKYGRVYLKCFSDNDTLFYLQKPYQQYDDWRKYYFLIVNKEAKDSILDNALNKDKHNIAFCYWDGVGIEKDREKAVMWMHRSAAQGYEKAKKALKTMGEE